MIKRQSNFLGQQRIDLPHLRAMESSVAADFDLLAGSVMAGSQPLVIKGFDLILTGAVGSPAQNLLLNVAGGIALHATASEPGTLFSVPETAAPEPLTGSNDKVSGSFVPGQANYVGLDLQREALDETSDLVMFLDPVTKTETPKTVPLARVLTYKILISTTDFSSTPNVLPLAKVITDSSNRVQSVTDCRQMLFRLGRGGSNPDSQNFYSWPQDRLEAGGSFTGGDKSIGSLKDFVDAVTTRIWELGGGEHWYSNTSDRDVNVVLGLPVLAENGDNFSFDPATGLTKWSGVSVLFLNSAATYNAVTAGEATLADGDCLYVDVDRKTEGAALTPAVASFAAVGSPSVPGSRIVLAWRKGADLFLRDQRFEVGRQIKVATALAGTSGLGVVRLAHAPLNQTYPTVLPLDANGQIRNVYATGNSSAFYGVGSGSGNGGDFTGGSTGGGVFGRGGSTRGHGVIGYGTGPDAGVFGHATGSGHGVVGSSTSGIGGDFSSGWIALRATAGDGTATVAAGIGAEIRGGDGPDNGGVGLQVSGGVGTAGGRAKAIVAVGDVEIDGGISCTEIQAISYRGAEEFHTLTGAPPSLLGAYNASPSFEPAANASYVVPLHLPLGAVVSRVDFIWSVEVGSGAIALTCALESKDYGAGLASAWAGTSQTYSYDVGTGAPLGLYQITGATVTIQNGKAYRVRITRDNSGAAGATIGCYGIKITYTISKPSAAMATI